MIQEKILGFHLYFSFIWISIQESKQNLYVEKVKNICIGKRQAKLGVHIFGHGFHCGQTTSLPHILGEPSDLQMYHLKINCVDFDVMQ